MISKGVLDAETRNTFFSVFAPDNADDFGIATMILFAPFPTMNWWLSAAVALPSFVRVLMNAESMVAVPSVSTPENQLRITVIVAVAEAEEVVPAAIDVGEIAVEASSRLFFMVFVLAL